MQQAFVSSTYWERTDKRWKLQVIFMSKGVNILQVEPLEQIHEIYRKVLRRLYKNFIRVKSIYQTLLRKLESC